MQVFSCEFCKKVLRTPYLQSTSEQLLLDFFIHLTVFATHWTRNQFFFYFGTCFIMAFNQLFEKTAPTQVFFSEYCKMFKDIYFEEHLQTSSVFQYWSQQATSCPSARCLAGQIEVHKPILVVATDQMPDHI